MKSKTLYNLHKVSYPGTVIAVVGRAPIVGLPLLHSEISPKNIYKEPSGHVNTKPAKRSLVRHLHTDKYFTKK